MSHPEQSLPQGLESVTEMQEAECSSNSNMSSTDAGTPQYSLQRQPVAISESYVGHSPGVFSRTFPAMASADLRQELDCSICLKFYLDPVTLRCGHNFCHVCIAGALDAQEGSGVYCCPECRKEFQERPALIRNMTLCNIVGRFRSTCQDQETGLFCSYCIHSPVPAAKSCLMCEAHLCDKHLRLHSKSPEHVLSDPTAALGNRKCSVHKKFLKYYCPEDGVCICVTCLSGEHRDHPVESLNEASKKRKEKLRDVLQKLSTKRAETEKRVQSLQESMREDQKKVAAVASRFTALYRDIKKQLEDLEKEVLSWIFRHEEQASLSVSDLLQQLEIKKGKLSRKMRHIEELCNMSDPVTVLQEPDTGDLCDTEGRSRHHTKVHEGGDLDVGLLSGAFRTLSDIIEHEHIWVNRENDTDLFLDERTAGCNIVISGDGKTAWVQHNRFQYQVISIRGFTSGRHCWDVKICWTSNWRVGTCYPTIERKGPQSYIGENDKSWCLHGHNLQYSVKHGGIVVRLPELGYFEKVRIVVDYDAGQLSFYSVDFSTKRLLHTFNTTFTEPLHAALWMLKGNLTISRVKSGEEIDK